MTKKVQLEKGEKPTLMQLRRRLGTITSRQVAEQAGIALREEYLLELGQPVAQAIAERVLLAFSQLAEKQYTLEDVDIALKSMREDEK